MVNHTNIVRTLLAIVRTLPTYCTNSVRTKHKPAIILNRQKISGCRYLTILTIFPSIKECERLILFLVPYIFERKNRANPTKKISQPDPSRLDQRSLCRPGHACQSQEVCLSIFFRTCAKLKNMVFGIHNRTCNTFASARSQRYFWKSLKQF